MGIGNLVAYPGQSFDGIFDGQNHVISNLTINDNTPNHAVAALFGSVVNGTIKNLTVKNVNITSTHYAAGIVAYTSNGPTIENCHVIGGTIKSTPEIVNGSYDNGDKVGGIMGLAQTGSTINNCTVEGVTISGYRDMGGIVGFSAGTVSNNTAINVTVTQDLTNGYKNPAPTTFGDIIGRDGGATLSNNKVIKGEPVAKIGEEKYYSLADAVAAAHEMTGDVTIELTANTSGYAIVHQKAGLNLTIDGADKKVTGNIIVDGDGRASGTETLTIQNIKFEGDGTDFCSGTSSFVEVPSTKDTGKDYTTGKYNYAHNITIDNCSFTSTTSGLTMAAVRATSGAGLYNIIISNTTGTNLHSLAQLVGTTGGSVTGNTVNSSESFVNVNGGGGEFTISGNTFTSAEGADGYGIRENGTSTAVITLTDNSFTAASSIVLGKGNSVTAGSINVESGVYTGTISKTEAATGKIAISGGYFSEEFPQEYIAEDLVAQGKVCTPATDKPGFFTIGYPHYVAQIGETGYVSLQAALDAAHEMTGDVTITLIDDITEVALVHQKAGLNLTIDGDGKTLKGQIYIDGDGRLDGTDALTIKNIKFAYDASTYDQAFVFAPSTKDAGKVYTTGKYNYDHNVTITDCEFAGEGTTTVAVRTASGAGGKNLTIANNTVVDGHSFAQLTGVTNLTITNNNVTGVKNGINISGGGGTATITGNTLQANTTEGYTVRFKDGNSSTATLEDNTFGGGEGIVNTATGGTTITINSGYYAGPLPTEEGKVLVNGGYFTVAPALAVCAEGLFPVGSDQEDYPFTVGQAVAEVNGNYYGTLEAAFAAATSGQTVKLLKDVALTERLFVNAGATPAYAGSGNRYATTTENKSITLDLSGYNVTTSSNIALAGGSLNIVNSGTADATHGVISTSASGLAPIEIRGTGDPSSKRMLTVGENVTLKGAVYGLNIFGTNSDTVANDIEVTVNGTVQGELFVLGNLKNDDNNIIITVNGSVDASEMQSGAEDIKTGIALNGNAKLVVNDGASVKGETGIEVRAGELTVNGGTITGTASEYSYTPNNSGTTIKGAAIAVASYDKTKDVKVTISDGTLSGGKLIAVVDVQNNLEKVTVKVKDAFVDGVDETVIPQDYKWASNGDGTSTLAPCEYVAQIGDVKYESLTDAVNAATTGQTIELLTDITTETGNKSLKEGVTLDGKGKTISGDIAIYISKNGGTVQNVNFKNIHNATKKRSAVFAEGLVGTATITDCTFDNCDWDAIQITPVAGANMVITNNTFSDDTEDGIQQQRYIHVQSKTNVDFSATITGNVLNGKTAQDPLGVYYPTDKTKVDLKNNYIENVDDICILIADDNGYAGELVFPAYTTAAKEETYTPEAYIQNDQYSAKFYMTFAEAATAAGNDKVISLVTKPSTAYTMSEGQTLKVKKNGKTFSTPKGPDGFVVTSTTTDGVTTYTLVEADIEYTTLAGVVSYKAWSNTVVSGSGTYKLLKDITASARIVPGISAADVTLDLNGHTLTSTASDNTVLLSRNGTASAAKTFSIVDTSTDGGGKIVANTSANAAIMVTGDYNEVIIGEGVTIDGNCVAITGSGSNSADNCKLTVNGTINGGDDFAIATNGSLTKNATININDGAMLTSNVTAMYLPGTGTTTISGGTITGSNGIYVKSGELNITGGEITGNGETAEFVHNPNGTSIVGAALVVENCSYPGGAPTVNVTGGTFTSANADAIASYSYGDGNEPIGQFVHGGYFSTELDKAICEEGKKTVPSTVKEGYYELGDIVYVAQIGETKYETLEEAWNAVNDGETITLLANCEGNGLIAPQGKFTNGLTVDFAGFTYNVTGNLVGSSGTESQAFQLLKDNKITFKGGTITSEKAKFLVQNYSNLTLEGMTLTLNNANYASAYTLSNNNGNVVIDGTTINANPAGGFAFDVCRYSSYPSVNVTVTGNSKINGDVEVSASGSDAKDGFKLMFESATLNGEIVLDASAKTAMANTPEKAEVSKSNTLTDIVAPDDYDWKDNGDDTSSLALTEEMEMILIDGKPYPVSKSATYKKVTYRRTFTKDHKKNLQAWYVPFNYTITDDDVTNFQFYKIHMIANSKEAGGTVTSQDYIYIYIEPLATGYELKANVPYLVRPLNVLTDHDFVMENIVLNAPKTTSTKHLETSEHKYDFYGCYNEYKPSYTGECYWMSASGLLTPGSSAYSLKSYRWYLKQTVNDFNVDAKATFVFVESEDGEATGINGTSIESSDEIEGVYSSNGVKLDTPQKGMNIIRYKNGKTKKIMVK